MNHHQSPVLLCHRFMLKIPVVRYYFAKGWDIRGMCRFPAKASSICAALERQKWIEALSLEALPSQNDFLFNGILTLDCHFSFWRGNSWCTSIKNVIIFLCVFLMTVLKKCTDSGSCVWENKELLKERT